MSKKEKRGLYFQGLMLLLALVCLWLTDIAGVLSADKASANPTPGYKSDPSNTLAPRISFQARQ